MSEMTYSTLNGICDNSLIRLGSKLRMITILWGSQWHPILRKVTKNSFTLPIIGQLNALQQQFLIHIVFSNRAEASNIGSLSKMIYVSASDYYVSRILSYHFFRNFVAATNHIYSMCRILYRATTDIVILNRLAVGIHTLNAGIANAAYH